MSELKNRLNPFVFPTETDGRFLLLLFVVAGGCFNLFRWLIFAYSDFSDIVTSLVSLGGTLLVFGWAWQLAKQAAPSMITKADIHPLSAFQANPLEEEQFGLMQQYIQESVVSLPDVAREQPVLLWDEQDQAVSGRAIGYGRQQYVLLFQGMFTAFVVQFETFRAVLLHELAHTANRDVSKTTFSIALGKCFYKTAVAIALLLNLSVIFHTIRRISDELSLAPIWEGTKLFLEMNIKLFILFILIEAIRSSILRTREYYADSRTAIWLGSHHAQLVEILQGEKQESRLLTRKGWAKLKQNIRRYLPLHPTAQQRIATLQDDRQLFIPRQGIAFLSGLLAGLALNSNIAWAITAVDEIIGVIIAADEVATNDRLLITLITGFVLLFIAILIPIAVIILFGLVPIVATAGIQIQKATFADRSQPNREALLPNNKLVQQALLLSSGLIAGFILTPVQSGLSIASVTIGRQAVGLIPLFWLGWAIVFLLWAFPLRNLAGQFYAAQRTDEQLQQKRRWLTWISTAALFPLFAAMVWTQMLLSPLVGSADEFTDPSTWGFVLTFIAAGWIVVFPLHVLMWRGGRYWLKRRGWLSEVSTLQAWATIPRGEPLPKPVATAVPNYISPPPL